MELWTAATPNGWKVSIMIEELIEAGVNLGEVSVEISTSPRASSSPKSF